MCMTIIFAGDIECEKLGDLLQFVDKRHFVKKEYYLYLDNDMCLCQIDIEKTLKNAGYKFTSDCFSYYVEEV